MVVSAPTLLTHSGKSSGMTTSLPNAVRVQLRSSMTRNVTTAMLSFPFMSILQMTSSLATLATCTQPGGKENALESTLLIRDARESTGAFVYWAKGMETTRLQGSGSESLGTCQGMDTIRLSAVGSGTGSLGLHNSVCVIRVVVTKGCMFWVSIVRLLDTLLEQ